LQYFAIYSIVLLPRAEVPPHFLSLQARHGSETWPVRKENVVALQRAEMRMVRWMCGVKR